MPCECQEPCSPQPYRCDCERDCWVGAPESYATCIEACEEAGCEFPDKPGLPSRGAECEDPVAGQSGCLDDCLTNSIATFELCFDAFEECEGESCAETLCTCKNEAQQDYEVCKNDCDRDFEYPGVLACSQTDVDESEACCNVTLSTCYAPCEDAYITAATVVEMDYLLCVRGKNAAYNGFFFMEEEACVDGETPTLHGCEREWVASMAPIEATRAICRATCEKAEIERTTPADRKYTECGGRYHLCKETCQADFDTAVAAAAYAAYPCVEACVADDLGPEAELTCLQPCYTTYRTAYATATIAQVECRLDCCREEYAHARNEHARAGCEFTCYSGRANGEVDCYGTFRLCEAQALEAEDGVALEQCNTDWCTCYAAFMQTYDACIGDCANQHTRDDCPGCYSDALEDIGSSSQGYGGAVAGMPTAGIGLAPSGCIE